MKTAKLGVIFLVSVLALAGIGASLAHWEETLTIDGIMTTDNIDPKFECDKSNDDPGHELEYRLDPDECGDWTVAGGEWIGDRKEKDVGSMTTQLAGNGKGITINIADAYPCYYSKAYWCTKNYGSVPVLIHSLKLVKISEGGHEETVDITIIPDVTYYVKIWYDAGWQWDVTTTPNDPDLYDFSIMLQDEFEIDTQLDPIGWGTGVGRMEYPNEYKSQLDHALCVHFENGCEQLTTYDFTIELCYYNWPEYT